MNIARFLHIVSAFYPESGESTIGDKCHQPRYLISILNDA